MIRLDLPHSGTLEIMKIFSDRFLYHERMIPCRNMADMSYDIHNTIFVMERTLRLK